MGNYSSSPTSLLAKNRGMDIHLRAGSAGARMHIYLAPTPTLSGERKPNGNISSGQQPRTEPCAGSHAHARRSTMIEEYKLDWPAHQAASSRSCWINFLKSFLALLMGYGKTNETNLTKEKNMGFDLYSLGNHKTEKGEYFRNSVWGWRRLADFVCEQTGVIAEDNKKYWQSNDGHEVSEQEAMQIAQQLKALIKDGTVSKAIQEVEEEEQKAKENNKFVDRCHDMIREKVERETGKTNLAPADYPKEDHDTWKWIQSKHDWGSSYPFTMENVQDFIEFCEQSNGFRIC